MIYRLFLAILCCLSLSDMLSQEASDSLGGNFISSEVNIVAPKLTDAFVLPSVQILDLEKSLTLKSTDLGTGLDRSGVAGVLANGAPGAASSLRFRGLGSDHTVLYWQGIPINSISLGTCDLSLIPSFFADQATLFSSAGSLQLPDNNFGVALDLTNNNRIGQGDFARIISSFNTLDNSFQGVDLRLSFFEKESTFQKWNERSLRLTSFRNGFKSGILVTRLKFFRQDLNNNFAYSDHYDPESPRIHQAHNNGVNQGVQQDIEWNWVNNSLGLHLWYQDKSVLLPSQMGHAESGTANQDDLLFRSVVTFHSIQKKSELNISSSYNIESLHYRDKVQSDGQWFINSLVKSKTFFNHVNYQFKLNEAILLKTSVVYVIPKVENTNYENGMITRSWMQSGVGLSIQKGIHKIDADTRVDSRVMNAVPAYTMNYSAFIHWGKFKIIPDAHLSHRLRAPDMNELYWNPGGNPNLKPESGMNYKMGIGVHANFHDKNYLGVTARTFKTVVNDWIQWVPGQSGYWTPVNYRLVHTKGMELQAYAKRDGVKTDWQLNARFQYTNAQMVNGAHWNRGEARSIIYTPAYSGFIEFQVERSGWSFRVSEKYTSGRFTEEQNLKYRMLPEYFLAGTEVGYKWLSSKMDVATNISADNILNVQYESVRSYAMPGRVIQLNLQLQLHIKKQNRL